jgi:DNA-binding FadR family transcriptional regulator
VRLYEGRGIHGETVATIGQRVVSGHYQAGEALLIDPLGVELGISRTAIREALKVLAAKGMVDSRPKRGTMVRPRSEWKLLDPDLIAWRHEGDPRPAFLQDLSEVRFIVEPTAARLAAERRDEDGSARDRAGACGDVRGRRGR